MTDQELSEVIRVYRQYNMSFPEFIKWASTRIAQGNLYDHLFMMGIHMLDKEAMSNDR